MSDRRRGAHCISAMVSWCCELGAGSRRQAAGCSHSSIHQIYQAERERKLPAAQLFGTALRTVYTSTFHPGPYVYLFSVSFLLFSAAKKALSNSSVAV